MYRKQPPSTPTIQQIAQRNLISTHKEQELFLSSFTNAVILELMDDAMLPVYEIGTVVGGKFLLKNDIQSALGKICIIRLARATLCRKLILGNKLHTFTLASLNPTPTNTIFNINDAEIIKVAPIIRIWKQ